MFYNSLFFQVILAGVALALVVIYIEPTFKEIGQTQNQIDVYQKELNKMAETNTLLRNLAGQIENISEANQRALLIYMPDKVDKVSVSRDLFNLAETAGLEVGAVKVDDKKSNNQIKEVSSANEKHLTPPVPNKFSINVKGKYEQLKAFLSYLEKSNYPLEVENLEVSSSKLNQNSTTAQDRAEAEVLDVNIDVVTYSHI